MKTARITLPKLPKEADRLVGLPDHTPGPWRWVGTRRSPEAKAYLCGPDHTQVLCDPDGLWISDTDAALIAAAPELADSLEKLLSLLKNLDLCHEHPFVVEARAIMSSLSK